MNDPTQRSDAESRTSRPSPLRRQRRQLAVGLLLLAAIGAAVRMASLRGLAAPLRISGGSMAETFAGEHYALACGACGMKWRCGVEYPPRDGRATCPNCGFPGNPLDERDRSLGDRVLVDRLAPLLRSPHRFDVVALQTPDRPEYLQVKRIVGLPGERIAIRGGELHADGRIVQKSLAQLREVAILVNDDSHRPTASAAEPGDSRWAPDRADSNWRAAPRGFELRSVAADRSFDWVTYRHRRSFAGPRPQQEDAVRDNYGYNQGVSRVLFEVGDLMLACRVRAEGNGVLAMAIHDGRDRLEAQLSSADGRIALLNNDVVVCNVPCRSFFGGGIRLVEFAVCDQQVLLAIDGRDVLRCTYNSSQRPLQPTSRPAAIGARGIDVSLADLRLMRDIYYLDPARAGWAWTLDQPLGGGQYLLLGDNAPVSVDGRRWQPPGIDRKYFLGNVLRYGRG